MVLTVILVITNKGTRLINIIPILRLLNFCCEMGHQDNNHGGKKHQSEHEELQMKIQDPSDAQIHQFSKRLDRVLSMGTEGS